VTVILTTGQSDLSQLFKNDVCSVLKCDHLSVYGWQVTWEQLKVLISSYDIPAVLEFS